MIAFYSLTIKVILCRHIYHSRHDAPSAEQVERFSGFEDMINYSGKLACKSLNGMGVDFVRGYFKCQGTLRAGLFRIFQKSTAFDF